MTREKIWTTAYGQTIKFENLSHSHLSNIIYYFDLVLDMGELYPIRKELNRRFGGVLLPYYPLISFKSEIDELVKKGYTTGYPNAEIIVNGKWIGKIKYD